jgi:hypothetical protein
MFTNLSRMLPTTMTLYYYGYGYGVPPVVSISRKEAT